MEETNEVTTITPAEQKETVILNQEDTTPEAKSRPKITPFFEKEPTEAELMGESNDGDDSADTQKEEKKEPEKEEVKKDDSAATEKKDDDKKEDEKKDDPDVPPKGYVSKKALKEEREKRKEVEAEMAALRKQMEAKKEAKPEDQEKSFLKSIGLPEDFRVLSEAEEDAMMEEDLFAYQKYQRNLRKYERADNEQTRQKQVADEINRRAESIVAGAVKRMETAVPGLHDPESEINKNLTAYAVDNGIELEYLNAMTDPKTLILPVGAKQPIYLGDGAASLVEFIHNLFKAKDSLPTEDKVREKLTAEITEKVTAELMKKFKEPSQIKHKSLGDAPGSMTVDNKSGKISEKDFAKMSEEDQARLLGG